MNKEYIIGFEKERRKQLEERLAPYAPHWFDRIPYCSVTVRDEQMQASLLEALAAVPGITYREALPRTALGGPDAHP